MRAAAARMTLPAEALAVGSGGCNELCSERGGVCLSPVLWQSVRKLSRKCHGLEEWI